MGRNQLDDLLDEARYSAMVGVPSDLLRALIGAIRARNLEGDALRRLNTSAPDMSAGEEMGGDAECAKRFCLRPAEEENRAVGLRPMTITPQAADELRALLTDDTPGHQGTPVPTRDARLPPPERRTAMRSKPTYAELAALARSVASRDPRIPHWGHCMFCGMQQMQDIAIHEVTCIYARARDLVKRLPTEG